MSEEKKEVLVGLEGDLINEGINNAHVWELL